MFFWCDRSDMQTHAIRARRRQVSFRFDRADIAHLPDADLVPKSGLDRGRFAWRRGIEYPMLSISVDISEKPWNRSSEQWMLDLAIPST